MYLSNYQCAPWTLSTPVLNPLNWIGVFAYVLYFGEITRGKGSNTKHYGPLHIKYFWADYSSGIGVSFRDGVTLIRFKVSFLRWFKFMDEWEVKPCEYIWSKEALLTIQSIGENEAWLFQHKSGIFLVNTNLLKIPTNILRIKRTTSDINDSSLVSADHLSRNSK